MRSAAVYMEAPRAEVASFFDNRIRLQSPAEFARQHVTNATHSKWFATLQYPTESANDWP